MHSAAEKLVPPAFPRFVSGKCLCSGPSRHMTGLDPLIGLGPGSLPASPGSSPPESVLPVYRPGAPFKLPKVQWNCITHF